MTGFTMDPAIQNNLRYVPAHLAETYLSLIQNTFTISDLHSPERFRKLHELVSAKTEAEELALERAFYMEHGETGLRELYFKLNRMEGRLDLNLPFLNITQLLQFLALAAYSSGKFEKIDQILARLSGVETFFILSDICISATSLLGDISALNELCRLFFPSKRVKAVALVLCATEGALQRLQPSFSEVVAAQVIPNIYSLRNESCIAASTARSQQHVLELAKWFAESVVQKSDLLWKSSEVMKDPEIRLWGFGKEGWLLTTDVNTPNNSFPLLWCKPKHHPYVPPYPRTSSRTYDNDCWNLRELYWDMINKNLR